MMAADDQMMAVDDQMMAVGRQMKVAMVALLSTHQVETGEYTSRIGWQQRFHLDPSGSEALLVGGQTTHQFHSSLTAWYLPGRGGL